MTDEKKIERITQWWNSYQEAQKNKMNKTMGTIKKILSILAIFVVLACEKNNFYFDSDSQTLMRCNRGGIRNLEITNDSLGLYYSINWSLSESSPANFSFKDINKGYQITLNGTKSILPANFELPEAIYKVEHRSNGDASSDIIQIEIKNQTIKSLTKNSCD